MGLFKRNNVWWMDIKEDGVRKRYSCETSNKGLATDRMNQRIGDIQSGKWEDQKNQSNRMLQDMIDLYTEQYTPLKSHPSRDVAIMNHLIDFFGEQATLETVGKKIGLYAHSRRLEGAKPATIVKELSTLRAMYNIARRDWKWNVKNPVAEIKLPEVDNNRVRYLTPEEYERLFRALQSCEQQWLQPIIMVAVQTGLRLSNVVGLTQKNISLENRIIIIDGADMKNGQSLGIPLTDIVVKTLTPLCKHPIKSGHIFHYKGKPLINRTVQRAFKKVLTDIKVNEFTFHDLRHTFASYLCQAGVPLQMIGALCGHRDTRMTQRYAHLNVQSLRQAISVLDTNMSQLSIKEKKNQGAVGTNP